MSMTFSTHQSPHRCTRCGLRCYRSTGIFYRNGTRHVVSDGGSIACPGYLLDDPPDYPWAGSRHEIAQEPCSCEAGEQWFPDEAHPNGGTYETCTACRGTTLVDALT